MKSGTYAEADCAGGTNAAIVREAVVGAGRGGTGDRRGKKR